MDKKTADELSKSWRSFQGRPTVAETGAREGDFLIGVCECNAGMVIQIYDNLEPCYDPAWVCKHELEDVLSLHNFVVVDTA